MKLTWVRFAHLGIIASLFVTVATGCASRRVVALENELLKERIIRLEAEKERILEASPDAEGFVKEPTLTDIAGWLDEAGFIYSKSDAEGADGLIEIGFDGEHTDFTITVQHFPKSAVLFLATHDYLKVNDAPDNRGVILLLVKLAALNYDLLIGKFQMDPESGDILLSAELHLGDGLGYRTFIQLLEHLMSTADTQWPELNRAAKGLGI